ncbi:hypothetical protein Patl1_18741 [Pistacia atlantica]|uniref:Uncharacterized protein n=1 Tax=Pistacia atlantica TaxID=434234 RepID=A0ACC1C2A0_9ROSI|nr:hypothetical protein Patl1_18741 [Pistacia atlantica]
MFLNEQLDKFKKQQEKCQATLTSIAAKSSKTSSSRATPVAASPAPRAPAPAVKFSNDTERLQHINSIRKAPVGAQIKRVIDLLLEDNLRKTLGCLNRDSWKHGMVVGCFGFKVTRQAFTPEQINEACYVDAKANKAVFDSLRNNPKVHYDGRRFSYKSKHDVKEKSELLVLIRKFPEGIAVIDLKDAYPTVMEDLQVYKNVLSFLC